MVHVAPYPLPQMEKTLPLANDLKDDELHFPPLLPGGGLAQLVERVLSMHKVAGSIPASSKVLRRLVEAFVLLSSFSHNDDNHYPGVYTCNNSS